VQPTQLSLMPEQLPAPPAGLLDQLPEAEVAAAVAVLARVIAKAAAGEPGPKGADDE